MEITGDTLDPRIAAQLKPNASGHHPIYKVTNLNTRGHGRGARRRHSSGGRRRKATTARLFG